MKIRVLIGPGEMSIRWCGFYVDVVSGQAAASTGRFPAKQPSQTWAFRK
jgi:hypothetical protein